MYCSSCGTPVSSGLSFCNRCGTGINPDRSAATDQSRNGLAGSLITGVVLVAILGLGIMCGGSIGLKKGASFNQDVIALFMTFTFVIVGGVELFLLRQLTRVLGSSAKQNRIEQPQQPLFQPAQVPASGLRAAPLHGLIESVPSVTEHTTRTLAQTHQFLK